MALAQAVVLAPADLPDGALVALDLPLDRRRDLGAAELGVADLGFGSVADHQDLVELDGLLIVRQVV